MRGRLLISALFLLTCFHASAQRVSDYSEAADSLAVLMQERTTVKTPIKLSRVVRNGKSLDLYFSKELSDYPWSKADVKWFRARAEELFPDSWKGYTLGSVYWKSVNVNQLVMPELTHDGKPASFEYKYDDPRGKNGRFIEKVGERKFSKGMSGRYIALWQSHGKYFAEKLGRWTWQRAPLHRTVEDMYTQSYVLPFLIPMLENAGAYVVTPRERDTNPWEVVADNDKAFSGDRPDSVRALGKYSERGKWADGGIGFADRKRRYTQDDNPFTMGTARKAAVVSSTKPTASVSWTFTMPERGNYAVYISYRSLASSTTAAHYTVRHMGGETSFLVDQTKGGSMWTYLGTFEFDGGVDYSVILDNSTPAGKTVPKNAEVTADAVRIGGGMGKVARGNNDSSLADYTLSGVPSYMEGALYAMQWYGVDPKIWQEHSTDYVNDYASRGAWTKMMKEDKDIPIDMSLAFHTDAGSTPNDSIVGTLAIYTLLCDGKRVNPDGKSRWTGRHLAKTVQDQVCEDIRAEFNPEWSRRQIWDRSYSECRTSSVPGMILELLSHQNFADMKFGLDPSFRFTVSRSVYKGMLKFMSDMYQTRYVVQPLPVHAFSAELTENGSVMLSWKPTEDSTEPTAKPAGYTVYTRIDGGAWDKGHDLTGTSDEVQVVPGHVYSYKISAWNDGGRSFPSEILSVGIPETGYDATRKVLIVNNFDRISAPDWFDTPERAGFQAWKDSGVPYIQDISYIGENYGFVREDEWISDDEPGFGASDISRAGLKIAGNTFDYPYRHGQAFLSLGYSFCSMSNEAFEAYVPTGGEYALDLICGKQRTTTVGTGMVPDRYSVFPDALQSSLRKASAAGTNLIVSGAYIASDSPAGFTEDLLGYKACGQVDTLGLVKATRNARHKFDTKSDMNYWNELNSTSYSVERTDVLVPSNHHAGTVMRYSDRKSGLRIKPGQSAAVFHNAGNSKTASFGFPLEALKGKDDLTAVLRNTMDWFSED